MKIDVRILNCSNDNSKKQFCFCLSVYQKKKKRKKKEKENKQLIFWFRDLWEKLHLKKMKAVSYFPNHDTLIRTL